MQAEGSGLERKLREGEGKAGVETGPQSAGGLKRQSQQSPGLKPLQRSSACTPSLVLD